MTQQLEIQTIIQYLKDEAQNTTMEGELLKRKMIRQLYTLLGKPTKEDFPDEFNTAGYGWSKHAGYTTYIGYATERQMQASNAADTEWNVDRPSRTKIDIVEDYTRHGWHCRVQAYNVLCTKYVKHPRYDNVWVEFYSSRDCNKYAYVIELTDKDY